MPFHPFRQVIVYVAFKGKAKLTDYARFTRCAFDDGYVDAIQEPYENVISLFSAIAIRPRFSVTMRFSSKAPRAQSP